jgi:subtilisin family serine protease
MKQVLKVSVLFFELALIVLLGGCLFTSSQRADENFTDGKMPATLEKFANYRQSHKYRDKISKIIAEKEQSPQFQVRVAVIDGGTEIYHPDLIQKIAWRNSESNKSALVGYDFMGRDAIPTPDRIVPDYFAYGSKGIIDGKIEEAPENPLELMASHNVSFMSELLRELKNSKELEGSLFAEKFNINSMSVFSAQLFLMSFDLEKYRENEEKKTLLSKDLLNKDLSGWKQFRKYSNLDQQIYYILMKSNWKMGTLFGFPDSTSPSLFHQIQNADIFYNLVHRVMNQFAEKKDYEKAVNNFVTFIKARELSHSEHKAVKKQGLMRLTTALEYILFPKNSTYTVNQFAEILESEIAAEDLEKNGFYPPNYQIDLRRIQTEITELQSDFQKFIGFEAELEPKLIGLKLLKTAQRIKMHLPAFGFLYQQYLSLYNLPELILKAIQGVATQSRYELQNGNIAGLILKPKGVSEKIAESEFRNYLIELNHPYYSGDSSSHSHGTHTAGIIAIDNPHAEIVPIRVTAESTSLSEFTLSQLKTKYKTEFAIWLKYPVVFRSLKNMYAKDLPQLNWQDESDSGKNTIVKYLMQTWSDEIDNQIDNSSLDHLFMDDVIQAIEFCGKYKIKVANVSMGTKYEIPVESLSADPEDTFNENTTKFLEFEFYKWKLAETIKTKAPYTLFVTALGNESNWVNGKSRSALPVDLSSPFLKKAEEELSLQAPNNHVSDQILGVISANSENELSSYTNIIIDNPELHQILYLGENVLSSIRIFDQDGFEQLKNQYLGFIKTSTNLPTSGEWLEPFLEKEKLINSLYEDQTKNKSRAMDRLGDRIENFTQLTEKILYDLYIQNKVPFGRMSGTSMATPGVVRRITYLLAEVAKNKGIRSDLEIYENSDFSPAKVIALVKSKTILKGQFLLLPDDPTIGQTKAISKSNAEIQFQKISGLKTEEQSGQGTQTRSPIEPSGR